MLALQVSHRARMQSANLVLNVDGCIGALFLDLLASCNCFTKKVGDIGVHADAWEPHGSLPSQSFTQVMSYWLPQSLFTQLLMASFYPACIEHTRLACFQEANDIIEIGYLNALFVVSGAQLWLGWAFGGPHKIDSEYWSVIHSSGKTRPRRQGI